MVSQDSERADMLALLRRHPVPFAVAMDSDGTWFDALGLRFVPSLVVLDRQGRVAGRFPSYTPEDHPGVVRLVESLLDEAPM